MNISEYTKVINFVHMKEITFLYIFSTPYYRTYFDAHSDTNDTYFGDNPYTHGTPFRRAIEEGLLDPKRAVQIGIRGSIYEPGEHRWAKEQGDYL